MQPYIKFFAFYAKENLIHVRVVDFKEIERRARLQLARQGRKLDRAEKTGQHEAAERLNAMMLQSIASEKKRVPRNASEAAHQKREINRLVGIHNQFKEEFEPFLPDVEKEKELEAQLEQIKQNREKGIVEEEKEGLDFEDTLDYENLYQMGQKMSLSSITMVTCTDFAESTKQLHQLARQNNIAQMRMRLQSGSDINEVNNLKRTPCDYAISACKLESVKFLVEQGAKLDFKGKNGSPLHYAAGVGEPKIFNYLLHEAKAPIDSRDEEGDTPLHYACAAGNTDFIDDLVIKNRVDIKNNLGNTPLHYACAFGHVEVVKKLLHHGAVPNTQNKQGQNAIHIVSTKNVIDKCINKVHTTDATHQRPEGVPKRPFPDTSPDNYSKIVKLLIEAGGDIHARTSTGRTGLVISLEEEQHDMIDMWLEHGADPNIGDATDNTPLLHALTNKYTAIACKLLDHGADAKKAVNVLSLSGLFLAIRIGDPYLVEKMIDKDADIHMRDTEGDTALHQTCGFEYFQHIQKVKQDHKSKPQSYEAFGPHAFNYLGVIHCLIEKGAHLEARDFENRTPLLHAARVGDYEAIELLLLHGADITAKTDQGLNALHLVCQLGSGVESMVPSDELPQKYGDKVKLMFKKDKKIPRFLKSAEVLIHYGVDMEETTATGVAPLRMARKSGYRALVRLLEQSGAKDRAGDLYDLMAKDLAKLAAEQNATPS